MPVSVCLPVSLLCRAHPAYPQLMLSLAGGDDISGTEDFAEGFEVRVSVVDWVILLGFSGSRWTAGNKTSIYEHKTILIALLLEKEI